LAELAQDNPAGTWRLFVEDDSIIDSGNIFGGWTLTLYYVDFIPSKFINSMYLADGTFQTTLVGNDGIRYQIQSSSNLLDWSPVVTTTVPGGSYTLTVPAGGSGQMRFYRAIQLP
jgi:subtilisin-like proprotein convertase family protein